MARGLKWAMILFGVVLVVEGVLDIVAPESRARQMGLGAAAAHAQLPMTILGATWVAAGLWVIVSARQPLRHINWVRFAITLPLLLLAALVCSWLRGTVAFQQVAADMAFDVLFVGVFLLLYPWRSPPPRGGSSQP